MSKVESKGLPQVNNNLKNLKPFRGNKELPVVASELPKTEITDQAKNLNQPEIQSEAQPTNISALEKAGKVAKALVNAPIIPVLVPPSTKVIEAKIKDPPVHFLKKPAVIFIEGFSAFGISNGDGITEMAENFPGAKKFSWTDHKDIIQEIKKHAPNQPLIMVGHSFGGDTAIEVASELNSAKNGFREVDLLVSIDAVGMNKTIIPVNVKSNLNYFGEGLIPFVHGDPTVARNTKYTEVTNELRNDMHSKMEDSPEVQFEIFNRINDVLGSHDEEDILIEISETTQIKDILEAIKNSL